jgi:hypothetical protein
LAEPPQRLAENFGLVFELSFVRDVLIVAAAANAEVGASRRLALGRGFEQPIHARAHELLFFLDRQRGDTLRRENEWHEYGRAIVMRQAVAAVNQFFDCDVHRLQLETVARARRRYVR